MTETIFIYGLVDPRDTKVYYVGRTTRPKARLDQHINAKANGPKRRWISDLIDNGLYPEMLILEEVDPKSD